MTKVPRLIKGPIYFRTIYRCGRTVLTVDSLLVDH